MEILEIFMTERLTESLTKNQRAAKAAGGHGRAQKVRLTDAIVRRLPIPERGKVIIVDADLPGFGARITANGARSYVLRYTTRAGRERTYTIGDATVWRTTDARAKAKDLRREIEDGFAMDAVDIYGLSEVMGPGVANECIETKDGLHIWEDHFYPEVIDPETGAVVAEGERGELVFTTLTKEGMPVIRYRTRDLTRLLPGTARTMRRMEKVTGRSDDMLIVRGVNLFPTQIEEQLLKSDVLSGHYQIVLTREGRMDEVAVHVEARPEYFDPVLLEAEAKVVVARIKDTIGLTTRVVVEPPGTIERSVGKARRVVDRRPKQ